MNSWRIAWQFREDILELGPPRTDGRHRLRFGNGEASFNETMARAIAAASNVDWPDIIHWAEQVIS